MAKKPKSIENKSQTTINSVEQPTNEYNTLLKTKISKSSNVTKQQHNTSINGSINGGSSEKPSQAYYKDLVQAVNDWFNNREIKVKSEMVFRKHISWKNVQEAMENKGYYVKDINDVKRHWLEICKYIKVERPLTEILNECDQAIEKLFKIPTQSGYSIFQLEQRNVLRQKHPDIKFIELHQKIAKRWNKLQDEQKKYYNDLAAEQNERNGVITEKEKKKRRAESTPKQPKPVLPPTIETYTYPSTALKDYYISVKTAELKTTQSDLPYKKRRSIASANFSKCSFDELTEIKKQYSEHLQAFINKVNQESPDFIAKIGQHIMETKRLRPLLEQPVISRFLSNIDLNVSTNTQNDEHSSVSSSPVAKTFNVIERYENSSLSSDASDDDNSE